MAISKITLNGQTQMDVTGKTVTSSSMLNGITALKNDGTDITGSITSKTSSDLTVSGATVTAPAGHYASAASKTIPNADVTVGNPSFAYTTESGVRKWGFGYSAFTENAGYIGEGQFGVHSYKYNAIAANTSVTPTESSQTIGGADTMMEGAVTINAIPSNYVGSGITQRSSSDLANSVGSDNRLTVTAPAGYYPTNAAKTIQAASATVSLSKSTASNHQITVSATKGLSSGYLYNTSQITTDSVSVSASELVSGTKSISSSGTTDVTNYASASVAAGSLTVGASKGTVSSHQVSVSPYVDSTSGFVGTGRTSGTAVTVSASELVSGTKNVTTYGTSDVTNYANVFVGIPLVTGTFTGTTAGAAMDVEIPYTGTGYPIVVVVYPTEGCFNENGTFYNTINRYACAYFCSVKTIPSSAPTYSSGTNNNAQIYNRYKASATTASTLDGSPGHVNNYNNVSANASVGAILKIKNNTTMSVFIKSTSYGFAQNVEYTYFVIYSS